MTTELYQACIDKGIPHDTAEWLVSSRMYVDIISHPMTFVIGFEVDGETICDFFSDHYLKNTPLEKIQEGFKRRRL